MVLFSEGLGGIQLDRLSVHQAAARGERGSAPVRRLDQQAPREEQEETKQNHSTQFQIGLVACLIK